MNKSKEPGSNELDDSNADYSDDDLTPDDSLIKQTPNYSDDDDEFTLTTTTNSESGSGSNYDNVIIRNPGEKKNQAGQIEEEAEKLEAAQAKQEEEAATAAEAAKQEEGKEGDQKEEEVVEVKKPEPFDVIIGKGDIETGLKAAIDNGDIQGVEKITVEDDITLKVTNKPESSLGGKSKKKQMKSKKSKNKSNKKMKKKQTKKGGKQIKKRSLKRKMKK